MNYSPTKREQRYFKQARKQSKLSSHDKARIGAVIVRGNFIAGRGCNQFKTHPVQRRYDKKSGYYGINSHIHAEVAALINTGRHDLTGAEIYIYREDMRDNLAQCRPCVSCTQALKDAGVKHVFYNDSNGYCYEVF